MVSKEASWDGGSWSYGPLGKHWGLGEVYTILYYIIL